MELRIFVDGGSRGNPGPSGAGIVIQDAATSAPLYEAGVFLGHLTNNVAEYRGLIRALEEAVALKPQAVEINSDSQLMVRQLEGQYRVKAPQLKPLYDQAIALLRKLPKVTIEHVMREHNFRADELANLAMDARRDVVVESMKGFASSSASKTKPSPTTASPAAEPAPSKPARFVAEVHNTRSPRCPARDGETRFAFGDTTPAGMCVHAAHAVLQVALHQPALPKTVRCQRCNALVDLTPES